MDLPETLQPWRAWLDWVSPELAPQISQMVRQLNPLFGPVRGTRQAGPAEPDALGDLHRRGPYDRLLAEELSGEFLHRAASGAHLLLAPRPQARHAAPLIVALLECRAAAAGRAAAGASGPDDPASSPAAPSSRRQAALGVRLLRGEFKEQSTASHAHMALRATLTLIHHRY